MLDTTDSDELADDIKQRKGKIYFLPRTAKYGFFAIYDNWTITGTFSSRDRIGDFPANSWGDVHVFCALLFNHMCVKQNYINTNLAEYFETRKLSVYKHSLQCKVLMDAKKSSRRIILHL